MTHSEELARDIAAGKKLTAEEALELARGQREVLFDAAEAVTQRCASRTFNLCAIINAKSGQCSENCRWCAQSSKWAVPGTPVFPIVPEDRAAAGAERAAQLGIVRYSLVTSGRKPSARELRELLSCIDAIRRAQPKLEVCVSLGLLSKKDLGMLKAAGVVRIHCNLETSRRFFPEVCSSHSYDDKIRVLLDAREAGLSVCSGGLLGIGETLEDRIALALALRELEVPSIPLNILHPIPGTPLGGAELLSDDDFLVAAALFRLINPHAELRFAGGRLQLSEAAVREAMRIGINAAICGDLLTTSGTGPIEEARRFVRAGYLPDAAAARALERAEAFSSEC